MPTYEYACRECDEHIEVVQSFSEDPLDTCGLCGGRLRKVFSAAGIIFKGSGYYVTDTRAARAGAAKGAGASGSGSSDSGSSDSGSSDSGSSDSGSSDSGSSGSSGSESSGSGSSASEAKSA